MTYFLGAIVLCLCTFGASSIWPFSGDDDDLRQCKEKVNKLNIAVANIEQRRKQAEGTVSTCTWDLKAARKKKQEAEANLAKYKKSFRCNPTFVTPYSFIATMDVSSSKLDLFIHTSASHEANFDFFSQRNPGPIVGVVGQFNAGKTFLINGISCQVTKFAEGVDISTPGISVSRVVCKDGTTFVLMDTAGLREAMKDDSGDGPVLDQLYTDFMLRMVDSYVLVVQEFTAPNQYFLDYVRKKLSPNVRMSVVHNFKHCTDQDEMESLANRTIRKVYPNAKKQKLFFLDTPTGNLHYIIGQNGSNPKITATNRQIFEHIRGNIDEIPARPESIRERFEAAVSDLLPPYLVQRDREASTTPISELLETNACEPLRWTENNETLDELLRSPYKCSKLLQFSWPGNELSLHKSSLQTGFLDVQKKDLLPRYVDRFTEEGTKLQGLIMDLPGCDITVDRSGGVVCHRKEVGATGALPSGWERLSADNVEQMRAMDQEEFILCNRHEYHNGILKLFYYKGNMQEYLLCGDEASFYPPFIALMVVSIVLATILMAYHRLYPAYRARQMSRDWVKCKKEICDSFHQDQDLDLLVQIAEKYRKCTGEYLVFVRASMASAYAQAANPNAITAKAAKQPLIPGSSLDAQIDYMRNIATKQCPAYEQLLTRLVDPLRLSVSLEVAPIKSKDRMIAKAKELAQEHGEAEGHRYITDVNRARIVCDNIEVMLRLMMNFLRLMVSSDGSYAFYQEKNLFGTEDSSAPPCVLLKIGLPYNKKNLNNSQGEKKTLDNSRQGNDLSDKEYWIVELQLTFKLIKEVAPFCHTLYEVTRAKELPMRCPGCSLLRLTSSENELKHS